MKSAAISAFPYRTQAVRDLAWACFGEPLLQIDQVADDGLNVAGCGLALTPQRRRWLERLDRDPAALLAQLARQPRRRLGLYFEQLWHFFLEQDKSVELVTHNLPVRDQGRTLGEFDVIYFCHERQRYFHLELAVKFYLGYRRRDHPAEASGWRDWLGPNANDRLDLKMQQLLQRQIRLADLPAARAQLAQLGVADPAQEISIKGYLFQSPGDPMPPPFGFNSLLGIAHWLRLSELQHYLLHLETERFVLLPPTRWLSPAQRDGQSETIGRASLGEGLQSLLAKDGRARLIAGMNEGGLEICRFFVTTDNWPTGRQQATQERS